MQRSRTFPQFLPGLVTVGREDPAWSTYSNIYNGLISTFGSYSTTEMFGNDLVGIAQAIVGAIKIPATSVAGNAGFGVAGYGITLSTSQGAVGTFGFGGIGVDGGSAWGFNTVVTNAPKVQPAANTGFDGGALYGHEMDFNIVRKAGGVEPNVPIRGIYVIGASATRGISDVIRAIDIDGLNYSGSKIPWIDGFFTNDGAVETPINLGAVAINTGATTTASQPIKLRSYLAGVVKAATIYGSAAGNIVLAPQAGGGGEIAGPWTVQGFVTAASMKTADYTLTPYDHTVGFDTSAGNKTATLPASPTNGEMHVVFKSSSDGNTLTIARNGNNIDGAASNITTTLTTFPSFTLQFVIGFGWKTT